LMGWSGQTLWSLDLLGYVHGRTGSSNRPWVISLTGPKSSDVTRNSGAPATNLSEENPPSLDKGSRSPSSVPLYPSIFDVECTWPADQPAHLTSAGQPGGPVRPGYVCILWRENFHYQAFSPSFCLRCIVKILNKTTTTTTQKAIKRAAETVPGTSHCPTP